MKSSLESFNNWYKEQKELEGQKEKEKINKRRDYYKLNKERIKEYAKKYYRLNKEKRENIPKHTEKRIGKKY